MISGDSIIARVVLGGGIPRELGRGCIYAGAGIWVIIYTIVVV